VISRPCGRSSPWVTQYGKPFISSEIVAKNAHWVGKRITATFLIPHRSRTSFTDERNERGFPVCRDSEWFAFWSEVSSWNHPISDTAESLCREIFLSLLRCHRRCLSHILSINCWCPSKIYFQEQICGRIITHLVPASIVFSGKAQNSSANMAFLSMTKVVLHGRVPH
jgi:hypothetical protein